LAESKETKSSESENAKIAGENSVDCYAKGIIQHEFVPEKQTVNGKFYKAVAVIKRLIARVHLVRLEFQESGSWYLLHNNAQVHSSGVVSEFLAKQGIPVIPSTLLP
jgi:hypothetical protein